MQNPFALVRTDRLLKKPLSLPPQFFYPMPIVGAKFLLKLLPQSLRQCWTLSVGGDRNLKRAAPDHGGIVKVAARRIIHHVREHASALRFFEHKIVHGRRGSSGYNQEDTVEVGRFEVADTPDEISRFSPRMHGIRGVRRNRGDVRARRHETFDLGSANRTRAHHEAGSTREFQEHRKQGRARAL